MDAPFMVGRPATGRYFVGRRVELDKINSLLSSPSAAKGVMNNVALLAQRRAGKPSTLYNLAEGGKGTVRVMFDAYGISTKKRFAKSYVGSVLEAYVKKTGDRQYGDGIKSTLSRTPAKLADMMDGAEAALLDVAKIHVDLAS